MFSRRAKEKLNSAGRFARPGWPARQGRTRTGERASGMMEVAGARGGKTQRAGNGASDRRISGRRSAEAR